MMHGHAHLKYSTMFPSTFFPIHQPLSILPWTTAHSTLLTASLCKPNISKTVTKQHVTPD
jgi:hypothetical protein